MGGVRERSAHAAGALGVCVRACVCVRALALVCVSGGGGRAQERSLRAMDKEVAVLKQDMFRHSQASALERRAVCVC